MIKRHTFMELDLTIIDHDSAVITIMLQSHLEKRIWSTLKNLQLKMHLIFRLCVTTLVLNVNTYVGTCLDLFILIY